MDYLFWIPLIIAGVVVFAALHKICVPPFLMPGPPPEPMIPPEPPTPEEEESDV